MSGDSARQDQTPKTVEQTGAGELMCARSEGAEYVEAHPEIRATLTDFVNAVFMTKPDDVYGMVKRHFSRTQQTTQDRLLRPLVICGPSGVGKGTLMNLLFAQYPDDFGFSVSHTTRAARPGEIHGIHYNFTTREAMAAAIEGGSFLEFAKVHSNLYGTSIDAVRKVQKAGKIVLLDIDTQGVQKIKETDINPHLIFIAPPSIEQLESRLRRRGTETQDALDTRIGNAKAEIEYGIVPGNFEHVVTNDKLETAYAELVQIIIKHYPHLREREAEARSGR